jgi:hypothetical protein
MNSIYHACRNTSDKDADPQRRILPMVNRLGIPGHYPRIAGLEFK